jgi:hypothetical protein
MLPIAHIAGIPVEEWAPFLVPVIALYLGGRVRRRRREQALKRLPDASEALTPTTTSRVLAQWSQANHQIPSEYLPLLYPPGPDGLTAAQLAQRTHADPAAIVRQLHALEDLGYLELRHHDGDAPRAWLTIQGYDLLNETERALLDATAHGQSTRGPH